MCTRIALHLFLIAILTAAVMAPAIGQENMFQNPTFDELDADGNPAHWLPVNFQTGGEMLIGTDGGHVGDNYARLRGSAAEDRATWRQHVEWDPADRSVTVTGWYRTVDVAEIPGRGASIRLIFNEEPGRWSPHLDIQGFFFEPSDEWTQAEVTYPVPENTRDVIVEFFHWFTPGETHWDNVMIRPATEEEMFANLLPPTLAVDREPIPGRNVPYSPADGETVNLNPPPFLWLPSGQATHVDVERWEQLPHHPASWTGHGEVTYRLQVGRDAQFAGDLLVDMTDIIYTAEMLTEPFAPGNYYWRYGVDLEDFPTVWSMARAFEVPADASLWPYPSPERFVVADTRPRLLIPAERVHELRQRAAEGDLQAIASALLSLVERHAGEELVEEPEMTPAQAPERGPMAVHTMRTTRPPMDVMERVAFAYLLTGDDAAGAEAKRRLLHFFSWDPQGTTGYFGYDEPAMWVMMRGVRAYDWTYELFTEEERELIEGSMRIRAADMYRMLRRMPFDNNPYSSHPGRTIGFLGEAAIAFYHEWEEAPEYLDYITRIYWGVYPAWGEDDGGWNEGPGYWNAYMSFALHFVLALREGTGIDLSERPFFQNTPYYALHLRPPHGQMSPFGDGAEWTSGRFSTMYWFSSLNRDPVIRWFADASGVRPGSDVLSVLLLDDSIEARPPLELPTARLFEAVGLVMLRTDLVMGDNDVGFLMKSSPFGAVSHGHNDQNCFVLEAYGEALAVSTGYYNYYGSPHHLGWTHQTKSKNGITFDGGEGQDRGWHARGAITDFVHGDAFDLTIGDATEAYGGRLARALREVVHVRPGLFVVRDDLASDQARTFEFQLHAIEEMTLRPADNEVVITRPTASLTTRFLEPASLDITQTDQFDPPPLWPPDRDYADLWHTTAAFTEARNEAEFLTVLMPARAGEEGDLPRTRHLISDTARGVELTFPDGRRTIVAFALPNVIGRISLEGFESDGHIFAVNITADGTPGDVLLHRGTSLTLNAQELVRD